MAEKKIYAFFIMDVRIEATWKLQLQKEFSEPYFSELARCLKEEYQKYKIFPSGKNIFNAFDHCSFKNVKVVIIGQDPYHGPGQANGLCFSVGDGIKKPPSLLNIFKELRDDLGKDIPESGNLERWAAQGVLLLNATLTVRAYTPGSHQNLGWEKFTDAVIHVLNEKKEGLVFILWGAYAQKKGTIIDRKKHFVIESPHPSPLSASRGFFGSKCFSRTNDYLKSKGVGAIDW